MPETVKIIIGMMDTVDGFEDHYATISEVMDPSVDPTVALKMWRESEARLSDVFGYRGQHIQVLNRLAVQGAIEIPNALIDESLGLND